MTVLHEMLKIPTGKGVYDSLNSVLFYYGDCVKVFWRHPLKTGLAEETVTIIQL